MKDDFFLKIYLLYCTNSKLLFYQELEIQLKTFKERRNEKKDGMEKRREKEGK